MELTHEFTVPASVEETWTALNDIEAVAGCFPGATVASAEGDTFTGSCKVKLGPIALVYTGSGTFVEKDEATRTMRIQAKGKDKRGNGTAGADVTATMAESDGGTTVVVVTDLSITGKPAQFGRGVIQDVSDKLLGQFVDCLAGRLGEPEPAAAEAAEDADAREGDDVQAGLAVAAATSGGTSGASSATREAAGASAARSDRPDEALDLGATVLPILVRTYGKQVAAAVLGLLVLAWLVRRLR